MPKHRSRLPKETVTGYWIEVIRILESRYRIDLVVAKAGVKTYRLGLEKLGVKDEIYHVPTDDTAKGIVVGEYVAKPPATYKPAPKTSPRKKSTPSRSGLPSEA